MDEGPDEGVDVDVVALVAWVAGAAVGVHLLARLCRGGGARLRATKVTRFPMLLLGGHPATSVAGLALWIAFLATGDRRCAWAAFAVLLVAAVEGFLLFTRWLVGRGGRHARGASGPLPARALLAHGLFAALTLVLVLTVALHA
ncbi:hypothetical protein [Actinomadura atramentaria]|uniref:hypothetical protein n=1 Tax=Actinomadura atramentaria TaxID=1990 RepID=UPI00037B4FEF|nr:hypothetical protein [Actinomadura atramentaria]